MQAIAVVILALGVLVTILLPMITNNNTRIFGAWKDRLHTVKHHEVTHYFKESEFTSSRRDFWYFLFMWPVPGLNHPPNEEMLMVLLTVWNLISVIVWILV